VHSEEKFGWQIYQECYRQHLRCSRKWIHDWKESVHRKMRRHLTSQEGCTSVWNQ
jgi:hypothetical protein